MAERWIEVVGWPKFQHYRNRAPIWIKDYLDQLDRDAHLALTFAERGLLADVRRLYARRGRALSGDTASLGRALNQRVLETHLQALVDAGFLRFLASKPLALPIQVASPEKEKRRNPYPLQGRRAKPVDNGEPAPGAQGTRSTTAGVTCPHCGVMRPGPTSLTEHIENVHYDLARSNP